MTTFQKWLVGIGIVFLLILAGKLFSDANLSKLKFCADHAALTECQNTVHYSR